MAYKKYNNDYADNLLSMPDRDLPETDKGERYHVQWAKAIHSHYIHGKAAIPANYQGDMDLLRQYGQGNQPIGLYLKQEVGANATSGSTVDTYDGNTPKWNRDGKKGLDMKIISVAPRVKSMIKAYLANVKEDVVVDTIDPKSGALKDEKKWKTLAFSREKDFIKGFMAKAGMKVDEQEFMPETMEQLEMFEQAGGFKLANAADMEKLIKYSMELSGYDDDLEGELYDDLMDIGIACTKKYLDPEDNKFNDKYVNPKFLAVQHSRDNNFKDIEWAGHIAFYTISEIKQYFPEKDENIFKNIASAYKGKHGNPADFKGSNRRDDNGQWGYDGWTVSVMEAEWIDYEIEEAVFYDSKHGRRTRLPVNEDTLSNLSDRKRYVKSVLRKLRQCAWIIGTDHAFDFGLANMQDRPAENKVVSNYHIRSLSGTPLMYQLRPVLDEMQVLWMRWQDMRANAVTSGYAIDIDKLKSIDVGSTKYSVGKVIEMWLQRGLLLYKQSMQGDYKGGKTLPIDKLPSTLLDELNEFIAGWDAAMRRMEDLTGINPLMLGATPDPNAPVATQKLSVASSANAIKPLGLAMNSLKRKSAESFMRRFTLAAKARKDIMDSYSGVIGDAAVKRLVSASKSMAQYGMFFHPRPTEAEKQALLDAMNASLDNRREGRPGIDLQTYLYVHNQLYAGTPIKSLRSYVGFMEDKIAKQDHSRQMEAIEAQSQQNQRNAQVSQQGAMMQSQQEAKAKMAINQQESQNELIKELAGQDPEVAENVARQLGLKKSSMGNAQNPQNKAPNEAI